jgi:P27 family predicted phage terminase small subunit
MKIKKIWKHPPGLGKHGRKLWSRVGNRLVDSGSLDELDRETFETLCRTYHKMVVADDLLEVEGLSVDSERGSKKHPAFTMWKSYSDLYVKLLNHFGLSPSSRGIKIQPKEEVKKDGKDRFFSKLD